ncbi:MAG: tetratricopeptide repeat protein [Spirochaetes bacterium]|nr:tetratricopeptide repeat protein [Spirochaetota bacterium]
MFSLLRRWFERFSHQKPSAGADRDASPSGGSSSLTAGINSFICVDEPRYSAGIRSDGLVLCLLRPNLFAWTEAPSLQSADFFMEARLVLAAAQAETSEQNGSLVESQRESPDNRYAAGFLFHLSAEDSFMYLMIGDTGAIRLDMVFNGEPAAITDWTDCPWINPKLPIQVQLLARGNHYAVFLNGRLALDANDDSIPAGSWAFAAQNFHHLNTVQARLEHFQLEHNPLQIEQLYLKLVRRQTVDPEQRRRLARTYMHMQKWSAAWQQVVKIQEQAELIADDHFMLGECYLQETLYADAEERLRLCLKLDPAHGAARQELYNVLYLQNKYPELRENLLNSPELPDNPLQQNLLGHALHNLGQREAAAEAYAKAADLDPAMPIYSLNAARMFSAAGKVGEAAAYWLKAGRGFLDQYADDDARECLDQLAALGYDKHTLAAMEARSAWQRGDHALAENLLSSLVKKHKADAGSYYLYGLLMLARGKRNDALKAFAKALETEPGHPGANFKLAESLYLSGADCSQALQSALQECPKDGWIHNLAGTLAFEQGRTEAAVEHFRSACIALPQETDPCINLASALARNGALPEALRQLERFGQSAATANAAGNLLSSAGRLEEALLQYQTACKLAGFSPSAGLLAAEYHTNLGACCIELDRWADAGEALRHALEIRSDLRSLMLMGDVWQQTGDYTRAETAWQAALELEPDSVELLERLGSSYCSRGRHDAAAELADRLHLVQPERGERLHQRILLANSEILSCSGCGRQWSVPRKVPPVARLRLRAEPPDDAPAGSCPDCGAIYCVACRKTALKDGRFSCGKCGANLKLHDDRIRWLVLEMIREAPAKA